MLMPIDSSLCLATVFQLDRDGVDLFAELALVLDAELGGQRLGGEAHVHHARRMAFRAEVDQPAFAEDVGIARPFFILYSSTLVRMSFVTDVDSAKPGEFQLTSKWRC